MKSRGFTLVELMGVITILAVLSLIIVPIVDKNLKRAKDDMYSIQIENIRLSAENYYSDNILLKPSDGNYSFIKLDKLISENYMDSNVKNVKTGEPFSDVYVQLENKGGAFIYKVCPLEGECEDYVE